MKTSDKIRNPTFGNDDPVLVSHAFLNAMSSEVAQLEAEIEALGGKNNVFQNALSDIADTSPNWMQKNAVEDSERRMRQIAQDALLTEGGENDPVYVTQLETELAEYKKHFEPQMIQIRLLEKAQSEQSKTYTTHAEEMNDNR